RPIGGTSNAPSGIDTVEVTVVSVGPYPLTKVLEESQDFSWSPRHDSPPTIIARRDGMSSLENSDRIAGRMVTTSHRWRRAAAARSRPDSTQSSGTSTSVAPSSNVIHSHTAASKLSDATWRTRVPGTMSKHSATPTTRLQSEV